MPRRILRPTTIGALLCFMLLAGATGCELREQGIAAKEAISEDQVPHIKEKYALSWNWPESASGREFSEVQARAFQVRGNRLYVVEGKDPQTGKWRVLYAAKTKPGEQWVPIRLSVMPPDRSTAGSQ